MNSEKIWKIFKVLKENPSNFKDLSNLAECDVDASVTAARRLVIKLYDSRGKIKTDDENLNKLGTRLTTVKSACLAKLPPCEATLKQHVLRASLQNYAWCRDILQSSLLRVRCSLVGKKDMDHSFLSTFRVKCLQDLIYICKCKAVCSSRCVCFEQGLSCTDICPCQAGEIFRNSNTQMSINKSIDDDDVVLLQLDAQE